MEHNPPLLPAVTEHQFAPLASTSFHPIRLAPTSFYEGPPNLSSPSTIVGQREGQKSEATGSRILYDEQKGLTGPVQKPYSGSSAPLQSLHTQALYKRGEPVPQRFHPGPLGARKARTGNNGWLTVKSEKGRRGGFSSCQPRQGHGDHLRRSEHIFQPVSAALPTER